MYTAAQIEDAILATLQSDATLAAGVNQWEILPDLSDATIAAIMRKVPAIGVIASSGRLAADMNTARDEVGSFTVLAFTRNLRAGSAAAHGTSTETGTWEIIGHCRRVLHDTDLGLSIIDCRPVSWALLFANDKGAACGLEVTVKWRHMAA